MKQHIKNHLSLTKKEWNGMAVLVLLTALVLTLPYVFGVLHKDSIINFNGLNKDAALLAKAVNRPEDEKSGSSALFYFDPNHLPAAKWKALGLNDGQVATIMHFEAKGGHFYRNTDLQKIYGITAGDYNRLEPYIDIPHGDEAAVKLKPGEKIELNTADSARLTEARGIGPSFAMRIIRYRGRLGGFCREEQLKEVYGVDSAKYAEISGQFTVDPARISKMHINSISFESLRQFPYLSYKQAGAVIAYREQHGPYASAGDLRNIAIMPDSVLRKMKPYLNFK